MGDIYSKRGAGHCCPNVLAAHNSNLHNPPPPQSGIKQWTAVVFEPFVAASS